MEQEDDLRCPITGSIYNEPVKCEDGFKYEKSALLRWVYNHKTSPMTRKLLTDKKYYVEDEETKNKIKKFLEEHPNLQEDLFKKQPLDRLLTYDITAFEQHSISDIDDYCEEWYKNMDEEFFRSLLSFDIMNFSEYCKAIKYLLSNEKTWVINAIATYKWDLDYLNNHDKQIFRNLVFHNNEIYKNYLIASDIIPQINYISFKEYKFLRNNKDYLVFLLTNGFNPNIFIGSLCSCGEHFIGKKINLLIKIIINKDETLFNILLTYDVDLTYNTDWGNYLHYACMNGNYIMIKTLIDFGLPLTKETSSKWSPVKLIIYYQPIDTVMKLIDEYGKEMKYSKNIIYENFIDQGNEEHNLTIDTIMDKRIKFNFSEKKETEKLRVYLKNKVV